MAINNIYGGRTSMGDLLFHNMGQRAMTAGGGGYNGSSFQPSAQAYEQRQPPQYPVRAPSSSQVPQAPGPKTNFPPGGFTGMGMMRPAFPGANGGYNPNTPGPAIANEAKPAVAAPLTQEPGGFEQGPGPLNSNNIAGLIRAALSSYRSSGGGLMNPRMNPGPSPWQTPEESLGGFGGRMAPVPSPGGGPMVPQDIFQMLMQARNAPQPQQNYLYRGPGGPLNENVQG